MLRHLRLIAVDIDGVLLSDTFSPVIHRFVVSRGGRYTAELERAVLSRPRLQAAAAMGVPGTPEELVEAYFRERAEYLRAHPVVVQEGAERLLRRLRRLGAAVVCYGGLGYAHFDQHLSSYSDYFDEPRYVCTDGFRPGLREITADLFGYRYDQALFIDDAASVAEAARRLGTGFIGFPSQYEHGFQRASMREAQVRHLVDCLDGIDDELLHTVDAECAAAHARAAGSRVA